MRPTGTELAAFALAWIVLAVMSLVVDVLPFRWVRPLLGQSHDRGPGEGWSHVAERRRAHLVATAVRRAAQRSPWRTDCYPQALTARVLLRATRVQHTVVFGLRRSPEGAMLAHAWVRAGDLAVTGGDGATYTEVGAFTWAPGRPATGR